MDSVCSVRLLDDAHGTCQALGVAGRSRAWAARRSRKVIIRQETILPSHD